MDENGKYRPFNTFKDEVVKLHETYNLRYLKTEYNTALRTSQAAAKWQKFERQKALFDLQYNTAGDSKVRKDHAKFNRITLPVDHAFWNRHTPPLDWECRCGLRQVAKGSAITPDDKLKGLPKVPKPFQFNAGKQQLVFSNEHPYIKNLSTENKRELQAVKDYGLKEARTIYAKGKGLLKPLKPLETKDAATKWFDAKAANGSLNLKVKLGAKTVPGQLSKKQFNHIVNDNKNSRWAWVHNVPKILSNANEVYVLNYIPPRSAKSLKTFRFISYFQDAIRVVNTDETYNVITSYEVKLNDAASERKGFLIYSNK